MEENTEQQGVDTAEVGLTDQTASGQVGDSAETAAPSLPEIEIERNGQVIKVPFNEAKDYVSKGYDYTQKTQELARERDSLRPYQEMATYLQANPDKAQAVYNLLAEQQIQGVDPVQQKMAHLEMVTSQLVNQNAKQQLDNMLSQINNDSKYEGLFKDKDMEELLLATAIQTGKKDFEGLRGQADKIHKKILGLKVESQKAGEKKVISNLNSPTRKSETGAGTYSPPKGFDPSTAGWKDINKRAVEML